jgi:hypothetical protein
MNILRNQLPIVALFVTGMILTVISWSFYRNAHASANIAAEVYAESLRLSNDLERFRNSPRIASLEVEPPDRIAARVSSAAKEANLSPLSILSVDPQLPVRVNRTAYQIRATQVVLQNTTLAQIAGFVAGLEDASSGMIVRDLSMNRSTVVGENDSELWNVRLTLTQMIFSPISTR